MTGAARFIGLIASFYLLLFVPNSTHAIETQTNLFKLHNGAKALPTGIFVEKGDHITIRQEGNGFIYPPGRTIPRVSSIGDPGCISDEAWLVPYVYCWSLVARIGEGNHEFYVGNTISFDSQTQGELFLGINHKNENVGSGSWNIRVVRNYEPPPPTPAPPAPFLDLPWEYKKKGFPFEDAALNINSYFDHEYPLLSTSLSEPVGETTTTVIKFDSLAREKVYYSAHDGYDWGSDVEASMGAKLLAAADGCATFHRSKKENIDKYCGHVIRIDHGNGYQTRYCHVQDKELVTESPTQCTPVTQGQQIGLVGHTGHTIPAGEGGAHIHFMVIHDKNGDGNFSDNIPDGLMDPFGWQGKAEDPWENYQFHYKGQNRTGSKSWYMWETSLPGFEEIYKKDTGPKVIDMSNYKISFDDGVFDSDVEVRMNLAPTVKISEFIHSKKPALELVVVDTFGSLVETLIKPITIGLNFDTQDYSLYWRDSVKFYSSSDGITWQPEQTQINWDQGFAQTNVDHLSYFALVGELKDQQPPVTKLLINDSLPVSSNVYPAPVELSLEASDSGQNITAWAIDDDSSWQSYQGPVHLSDPGVHTIWYYSEDESGNVEQIQESQFEIIDLPPELQIQFNPQLLKIDIEASSAAEINQTTEEFKPKRFRTRFTDSAGNWIELVYRMIDTKITDLIDIETIQRNDEPIIKLPKNRLLVITKRDGSKITQSYKYEKYRAKSKWEAKADESVVEVKNGKKIKEVKPGLVLLKLTSNNDQLEIRFE